MEDLEIKNSLKVSRLLIHFLENEVLNKLGLNVDKFWEDFEILIKIFAPKNENLLKKREDIKKKIGRNTLEQLEILYKNYQMLLKVVKGRRNNKNKHLGQVFNVAKNPKATLRFMQNNLSDILKWMEATIEEIEKENTFIENLLQEKRKIKGGNKEYTNMWFYISRKAKPKILETKDFKSIHIIRLIKLVKTTTLSLSGKLVEELTIMDSNKKHAYNINYGALATVLENMLYKRYVKKDKKSKTVILNGIVINFNNTDSAKILRYLSRKVNIIYRYLK